jgi:hypothetical protein
MPLCPETFLGFLKNKWGKNGCEAGQTLWRLNTSFSALPKNPSPFNSYLVPQAVSFSLKGA